MSASSFERKESVPQSRLTQLLYPKFPSQPFIMESKREVKKSPVSHNHVPAGTPLVKVMVHLIVLINRRLLQVQIALSTDSMET